MAEIETKAIEARGLRPIAFGNMGGSADSPKLGRVTGVIYGGAGVGKSVCIYSLLKLGEHNPNLKFRILFTESNAWGGFEAAMRVHNITMLYPGQVVVAVLENNKGYDTVDSFTEGTNHKAYDTVITNSAIKFKGFDITDPDKTVIDCGSPSTWKDDVIYILDGFSMVDASCIEKGRKKTVDQKTSGDPRALFYARQNLVENILNKFMEESNCHIFVAAHQTIIDDEAAGKSKLDYRIHPAMTTRSQIDKALGHFGFVYHLYKEPQTGARVISVESPKVFTIPRFIDKSEINQYNTAAVPKKNYLTLATLPADLTHPVYKFPLPRLEPVTGRNS